MQAHVYDMTTDMEIALLDSDLNLSSLNHAGADGLISSITGDETSYYSYNPHADVSLITDESGETTASLHYDAWGNTAEETDEPYTYLGKHQRRNSHSTGLIKMGARFYDPETGRFISRDPLSGHDEIPVSRNPYVYANDDPVNMKDLSGLCATCDFLKRQIRIFVAAYAATGSAVYGQWAHRCKRMLESLQRKHMNEKRAPKPSQTPQSPKCDQIGSQHGSVLMRKSGMVGKNLDYGFYICGKVDVHVRQKATEVDGRLSVQSTGIYDRQDVDKLYVEFALPGTSQDQKLAAQIVLFWFPYMTVSRGGNRWKLDRQDDEFREFNQGAEWRFRKTIESRDPLSRNPGRLDAGFAIGRDGDFSSVNLWGWIL
ncbi:MAG: RHS repeat-associated core domain-containing protein [Actinomycetia bacterium]|nr:RHS repeat-associated core domain-containing protein [Actinomycetes bacterium]